MPYGSDKFIKTLARLAAPPRSYKIFQRGEVATLPLASSGKQPIRYDGLQTDNLRYCAALFFLGKKEMLGLHVSHDLEPDILANNQRAVENFLKRQGDTPFNAVWTQNLTAATVSSSSIAMPYLQEKTREYVKKNFKTPFDLPLDKTMCASGPTVRVHTDGTLLQPSGIEKTASFMNTVLLGAPPPTKPAQGPLVTFYEPTVLPMDAHPDTRLITDNITFCTIGALKGHTGVLAFHLSNQKESAEAVTKALTQFIEAEGGAEHISTTLAQHPIMSGIGNTNTLDSYRTHTLTTAKKLLAAQGVQAPDFPELIDSSICVVAPDGSLNGPTFAQRCERKKQEQIVISTPQTWAERTQEAHSKGHLPTIK